MTNLIKITGFSPTQKVNFTAKDAKKTESKKENKKYTDPLMKWPARGLAYTNELGAAISEVAPKMGTLLWFPAMLYFGADIYDKYKNEKTSYAPDAKRGTEQAIFQFLASVILPTGAVLGGQKLASFAGAMDKTGLSLQSREETINFLQGFVSRRHLDDYANNIDAFKEQFKESISIKQEKLIRDNKWKKPFRMLGETFFNKKHPEALAMSEKDRILTFANEHIDKMFNIYNDLAEGKKPEQFSEKLWKNFNKLKDKYAKDPDYKATALRDATEDIIRKYQNGKIMNTKMLKTLGGFVALGLAINPIDKFVENVVIKKFVEPNLNTMFANKDVQEYKNKTINA